MLPIKLCNTAVAKFPSRTADLKYYDFLVTPIQEAPNAEYVLDAADLNALNARMRDLRWLSGQAAESAERIDGGNMNMTVRLRTRTASHIVKQARPWVVKYPAIPAPIERAAVEAGFYRNVAATPALLGLMPRLHGFDPETSLLWLEDLGERGDLSRLYRGGAMSIGQCESLCGILAAIHAVEIPEAISPLFRNRAMRILNHEHQYDFPLRPHNGMDLDALNPGLAAIAETLRTDDNYRERVAALGALYLADGNTLVHGDYFPGSWLVTERGLAVIDPEFCHLGFAEYDLGVFLAHLEFIRSRPLWDTVAKSYPHPVDWPLARRFAGAEIMRRLIGVAQLPLDADLATKQTWLELSRTLVCEQ